MGSSVVQEFQIQNKTRINFSVSNEPDHSQLSISDFRYTAHNLCKSGNALFSVCIPLSRRLIDMIVKFVNKI